MELPTRHSDAYRTLRRAYLMRHGQWPAFCQRRDELKASVPNWRERDTILEREFLPEGALEGELRLQQTAAGRVVNPAVPPTDSPVPEGHRTGAETTDLIDAGRLRQKDMPWPEVQDWVAKHIEIANVQPEDAPNAEAWGLLVWARKHKKDFWLSYGKQKAAETDESAAARDMKIEELLKQLTQIRDGAIVEAANAQKQETAA